MCLPSPEWGQEARKQGIGTRGSAKAVASTAPLQGDREELDGGHRHVAHRGDPPVARARHHRVRGAKAGDDRLVTLHVVRLEGKPVAGALSYSFRDWIEVPSASSLREHRALCPNHLMYWSIIRHAIAEGRRTFDFGRSTPNDSTFAFKEQWGAQPERLFWEYSLLPGAALPSEDRHSSKFRASIEGWKRLPVGIATLLGPRIARSVP